MYRMHHKVLRSIIIDFYPEQLEETHKTRTPLGSPFRKLLTFLSTFSAHQSLRGPLQKIGAFGMKSNSASSSISSVLNIARYPYIFCPQRSFRWLSKLSFGTTMGWDLFNSFPSQNLSTLLSMGYISVPSFYSRSKESLSVSRLYRKQKSASFSKLGHWWLLITNFRSVPTTWR